MPCTLSYAFKTASNYHVYSKSEVTEVSYQIRSSYLYIFFTGSKTYDEDGEYGDSSVYFLIVIKDSNDKILYSDDFHILSGMIPGKDFGPNGYLGWRTVEEKYLKEDEHYTVELVDYEI